MILTLWQSRRSLYDVGSFVAVCRNRVAKLQWIIATCRSPLYGGGAFKGFMLFLVLALGGKVVSRFQRLSAPVYN